MYRRQPRPLETGAVDRTGFELRRPLARLDEHVGQTRDLQHRPHLRRRADDGKQAVDALELLVTLHQDGNAGQAHEVDARALTECDRAPRASSRRGCSAGDPPMPIEPSADPQLEGAGDLDSG